MAHPLDGLSIVYQTARARRVGAEWSRETYSFGHTHMYFVESGAAILRHSGREFRMAPGRMYLVPAHAPRSHRVLKPMQLHWVHFGADLGNGLELTDHLECDYELACEQPGRVRRMFERLEELRPGPLRHLLPSVLEIKGLILTLLAPFFPKTEELRLRPERSGARRFQGVLAHIQANLGSRLSIEELARLAHLERNYFSTLFTKTMGVTPVRYIQTRRVSRAQQLLTETELPLSAIAGQLGFTDSFYFSKVFKKITGQSPQAFRRDWIH